MAQPNRPRPGDFTGKTKHTQARDQQAALRERRTETTMITAAEEEAEATGLFDPQSQERIDVTPTEEVIERPPAPQFGEYVPPSQQEPVFTGHESEEELAPYLAARDVAPPPVPVADSAMIVVRVDQDIEKMTYGMRNGEPNNFDFREGLRYKVPRELAEHLRERDLVRSYG